MIPKGILHGSHGVRLHLDSRFRGNDRMFSLHRYPEKFTLAFPPKAAFVYSHLLYH